MWGLQPALRRGAVMITLVACVGIAAAQKGYRGAGGTDASAMDETTGSVSSPGAKRAGAELALLVAQRELRALGAGGTHAAGGLIHRRSIRVADAARALLGRGEADACHERDHNHATAQCWLKTPHRTPP